MNTYQYDLVHKLSFIRYGGTEDEFKAAVIILKEIEELGGCAEIEDFNIPACKFGKYSVKVAVPYEKELEVMPMRLSGSFPSGGVDLKLFYAEDCSDAALYGKNQLFDTAVMVNDLTLDVYKRLCERKAGAVLVIKGKWYDHNETTDFLLRELRPPYLSAGKIPTFFVRAKDAAAMVREQAEILHIELEQEETETSSYNVVSTIKGNEIADESVIITAHIDSVNVGAGSWDNATGVATALYIYKYFLKNKPKRTMHFLWCGSEEQGLLGSKAYISRHSDLFEDRIKFGFNFDMCGTILGHNKIYATGGDELKDYAQAFCNEYGINAAVHKDVRSSDSAPIADKGIPTLDLFRRSNAAEIHTRFDLIDAISAKQLKKDGDFAIAFIERVVNSARLPVGLGMPDDMKDKLDKYFQRQR